MIEKGTKLPSGKLLDWDTKVADILGDDWKLEDEYATKHLDLTDLLSMRSGMPSHDLWYKDLPPLETIKRMRNLPFTAEIRQGFQYNNLHYVTLSHIVTVLSGRPFHAFVNEHFFAPLDMRSTTYNSTAAGLTGERSDCYYHTGVNLTACLDAGVGSNACQGKKENLGWWIEGDSLNNAGPGGIMTSLWDISAWQGEYLHPMQTEVTPRLIAKLGEAVMPMGRGSEGELSALSYGLAQMTLIYRGERVVFHTGGLPGQISQIWNLPDRGLSIAVFTNDANFGSIFMRAASCAIVDEVLDLPRIDWRARAWDNVKKAYAPPATPKPEKMKPLEGQFVHKAYGHLNVTRVEDERVLGLLPEGFAREKVSSTPLRGAFTDHLVFTPFEGNKYNWTTYKYDPPMFMGDGTAVVTDKGLGMFGHFSTPGNVKLHPPSENPEDAEVYFERV